MNALAAMKAIFPMSSVRNPRIFRLHRPVAKTKDESQDEERREADQAAKPENEKRGDNPKAHDDQSRIETDPGHRDSPRVDSPVQGEGEVRYSFASTGSGAGRGRAFTGRRRKSGT